MAGETVRFEAVVEPLVWGRNTYTVLKVPDRLARSATLARTRRVEGTINGVEVNAGLNRADVIEETFLYVGKPMLRRIEAALGDVVDCALAPADPDRVPVPDDVVEALERGGRTDAFERLPASRRRQLLVPVEAAARADTRARRLDDLIRALDPG
ncbi:YdeI/OmpD-associated family protein [Nocardioides KLBMP 9356]|uniref:YdeI/OmpD-associated family protein n=1 Tax=Nocardioides potassii TaxID=2911371 RepID=A0ABS9H891_9ACTN|nr:YdeI/OmpD-associated family protein [Nocardioides potassii]MCF6376338.1 YdeI/OmpD-associated family protein [Nocardioides potassii]